MSVFFLFFCNRGGLRGDGNTLTGINPWRKSGSYAGFLIEREKACFPYPASTVDAIPYQ